MKVLPAIKPVAALMLALVLMCTSITMAVARGQTQGGMVATLCSPDRVQTVVIDADGNPVPAAHICPYCIIGAAVLPDGGRVAPVPVRAARALDPMAPDAGVSTLRPNGLPEARAPPLSV